MTRFLFVSFLLITYLAFGQKASIQGVVLTNDSSAIEGAKIEILDKGQILSSTITNKKGKFEIKIDHSKSLNVFVSHISYQALSESISLNPGERRTIEFYLSDKSQKLGTVVIKAPRKKSNKGAVQIDKKHFQKSLSNENAEAVIFTEPSVSQNNEFSSQYSVRGGNFDENLVYVNDIQVYRPFLVRAGRQEGLSFVNPDLIENISFSAGGFSAKYGDKLSSVLDIKYKIPDSLAGSFSASLLGGRFHFENASKDKRFNYIFGARYKSNTYLLNGLDTDGEYQPQFFDFQTFVNYQLRDNWKISFLGNISDNQFIMVPTVKETNFGMFQRAINFKMFFEGQERDRFTTYFGALSSDHIINERFTLKFIASSFQTYESETFDLYGQYFLSDLETNFGQDNFGETTYVIGTGGLLDHSRNFLNARVSSFSIKGTNHGEKDHFVWGVNAQNEIINDKLKEWSLIDSAGYALPLSSGDNLILSESIQSEANLNSNRFMAYGEWEHEFSKGNFLSLGARVNHWDYNNQTIISPRASYTFTPNLKNDTIFWSLRFSAGSYQQPPFYRELRNLRGQINPDLRAQSSVHFVASSDYYFQMWNKDFKWTASTYYKHLYNLVPYEVENVRIRYYAENSATGYTAGVESKLYGEFIPGTDSWFSIGVLKTEEDIQNDEYYLYHNEAGDTNVFLAPGFTDSTRFNPGFIPRPTDQRVNVGVFFSDHMPNVPALTMHVTINYGSRLPFGAPNTPKALHTFRMPAYRRVDIGFAYQIVENSKFVGKSGYKDIPESSVFKSFENFNIKFEVFNLLEIRNTISYLWVDDVNGGSYAVPNYLTNRLFNLRIMGRF